MVLFLGDGRVHQRAVLVQNGLREAGRAGGEVDRGVVVVRERDARVAGGAVVHEFVVAVRPVGAVRADVVELFHLRQLVLDFVYAVDEFVPEDEQGAVREIDAVFDLVCSVAVVERHGERAGLEDAKVDRQPLKAVHQKDADLVALLDAVCQQEMREAVGAAVKVLPAQLAAVGVLLIVHLDEGIFLPRGLGLAVFVFGVDLDERGLVRPFARVALQKFCDWHDAVSFIYR